MNIIVKKSIDNYNLHEYTYSNELISEIDGFSIHTISKKIKNNPLNEIVNILFYDCELPKTPEEISVDTELSEIIDITFFTYESQKDEDLLNTLNIIEHDEVVLIDIERKNVICNNLRLERDLNLRWIKNEKAVCIVFSDFNENVHSYYTGDNLKILLDDYSQLQGFIFEF